MSKKNTKQQKKNSPLPLLMTLLFGGVFIYLATKNLFLQDDTYITLRYVRNFINGDGLVFNLGERVEGYTCLLWVMVLSMVGAVGANIEKASQMLSIGFGVITLFLTYKISAILPVNEKTKDLSIADQRKIDLFNIAPVAFLTFTGAYLHWAVSGMETTMFITFVLLGIYFYLRDQTFEKINYRFAISMFLASLTRPEGLYIFAIVIFHQWLTLLWKNKTSGAGTIVQEILSRNNVSTYLVFIIPNLVYILLRYWYYGYPLPNTYYAKAEFTLPIFLRGIEYTQLVLKNYLLYGAVVAAPLLLLLNKTFRPYVSLFYTIIFLYTAYIISMGGDVLWAHHRFFLVLLPLIYILFSKFFVELYFVNLEKRWISKQILAAGTVVIVSVIIYYNYQNRVEEVQRTVAMENGLVDKMKITGQWLNKKQTAMQRPIVIAASTIGAVSYFSNVTLIDMIGLTDETIAHNPKIIPEISEAAAWNERKYNVEYVLSRKPDFIYFSTGMKPSSHGERALFAMDEFVQNYYQYYFSVPGYDFTECIYKRKEISSAGAVEPANNPNYKKSYPNLYNEVINLSRNPANIKQAIEKCEELIRISPPRFNGSVELLGNLYQQAGNNAKALECYKKAIEIDECVVLPHYHLYRHYVEQKDTVNAALHFGKLRRYAPDLF